MRRLLSFFLSLVSSSNAPGTQEGSTTATATSAATVNDWSALPGPALVLISARLATFDYGSFRSVCSAWRSAVPAPPHPSRFPWLVGRPRGSYDVFAFLPFGRTTPASASASVVLSEPDGLGVHCCGSSQGWLVLKRVRNVALWNPLTGTLIQLPPSHLFPFKVVLSSDDPSTSSGCVVLSQGHGQGLAFCRPGSVAWIEIETPYACSEVVDPVFFRGRFYLAIADDDPRLYACDVGPSSATVRRVPPTDPAFDARRTLPTCHWCFLVESSGELLLVAVYCERPETYRTEVYQVEWVGEQVKLLKLRSLGDRALFLGMNHAFSLAATELGGRIRRNCIYLVEYHNMDATNVRVIDLEERRNELISNLSEAVLEYEPCAWFTPTYN